MTNFDSADGPPPFEDAFDDDVEQRIYGTILQTRKPTAASAIADTVDCDPKTARKYLDWFVELEIVTKYEGHPTTYERNDSYFEWRRINQLASEYSLDELQQRITELSDRIEHYERKYEIATPEEVDALGFVEESDANIDDVYSDLGDWTTARQERHYYDRARQQLASSNKREQASG